MTRTPAQFDRGRDTWSSRTRTPLLVRAPVHAHEADRLESLESYAVLDTAPEPAFDAVVQLAARLCDTPSALIGLIDEHRQWYKASVGVARREVHRGESFCTYVVAASERVVVPDARLDERFANNPAVTVTDGVRAYAGVPLVGRDGLPLGTLCVFDHRSRDFTASELDALEALAEQAVALLELRRHDARLGSTAADLGSGPPLHRRLRTALERGELVPAFQPIVELATGRLRGLEALLRWEDPARGRLLPESFLPAVENSGLVLPVGRHVLDRALARLSLIRATHPRAERCRVALNVSPLQLARPGFADGVIGALARHDVPGDRLVVELTETVPFPSVSIARAELERVREAGVHVAVDDYGSGHSSLERVLTLPIDALKLDRHLVQQVLHDTRARAIVRSTLLLADDLGLAVIAEGVETEAERLALLELGCRHGQGFLYSPAIMGPELEHYLGVEYAVQES